MLQSGMRRMCRWCLPGIWAYAAFITANNYLQSQKIVQPEVVTSAVVLAVHPLLNLVCIHTFGTAASSAKCSVCLAASTSLSCIWKRSPCPAPHHHASCAAFCTTAQCATLSAAARAALIIQQVRSLHTSTTATLSSGVLPVLGSTQNLPQANLSCFKARQYTISAASLYPRALWGLSMTSRGAEFCFLVFPCVHVLCLAVDHAHQHQPGKVLPRDAG